MLGQVDWQQIRESQADPTATPLTASFDPTTGEMLTTVGVSAPAQPARSVWPLAIALLIGFALFAASRRSSNLT